MTQAVGFLDDYVSMRPRARLLGGLLVAGALVSWIAVGFDLADFRLLGRELGGVPVTPARKGAYRVTGDAILVVQCLLLAAGGVAFVEWLYQSRINLRAFGVRDLRYPRGWALAAFLVPLLNLIRPYQVIREVWQASDPRTRDPFEWTGAPIGWLLPLWWGVFVSWLLLALLGFWMTLGAGFDTGRLQAARGVATAVDLAAAIGVSLAYFVVEHISEAQEKKWGLARPR